MPRDEKKKNARTRVAGKIRQNSLAREPAIIIRMYFSMRVSDFQLSGTFRGAFERVGLCEYVEEGLLF